MARLRFTILGCGASPGVPRIDGDWGACDPSEPRNRRSRCSALVERFGDGPEPTRVLIDTGPDLRYQLAPLAIRRLDGVVYTHSHADHIHGIDDLRAYWIAERRLVPVYSDDVTQARLDTAFGYCFATPPGGSYPPILRRIRIAAGEPFAVAGPGGPLAVHPFRQLHGEIDSLGLRIGPIAYSCDVSDIPPESLPALSGLEVWIADALRDKRHQSHFSVAETVAWHERLKPGRTILTHMHADIDYADLRRRLPPGIEPAHDGLVIETLID